MLKLADGETADAVTVPAGKQIVPLAVWLAQKTTLAARGDIELNFSGCINACGHHHIGNIGILGVDKDGSEWYQVSIGGKQGNDSAIGKIIGPSFSAGQMPEVIGRLLEVYVRERQDEERFIDTVDRIGIEPFKTHVYATPIAGHTYQAGEDAHA